MQFPQPAPCSLLVPSQRHTKVLSYQALCILLPSFFRSTQDAQCLCFSLPQRCIQGGGSPTYNIASCLTTVSPTSDVSSLTLSGPHPSPYHQLADRQHHKDTQLSQLDILVSFEEVSLFTNIREKLYIGCHSLTSKTIGGLSFEV